MKGAGPQILGTRAKFKQVPCQKNCRVNRALVPTKDITCKKETQDCKRWWVFISLAVTQTRKRAGKENWRNWEALWRGMYALRYVVGVDYHSYRRVREKVGEGEGGPLHFSWLLDKSNNTSLYRILFTRKTETWKMGVPRENGYRMNDWIRNRITFILFYSIHKKDTKFLRTET